MLERITPLNELVTEVLGRIPSHVWESDSTTFFIPAVGGGQFASAVEKKLRESGHSNENIQGRVFGFEHNQFLIDLAVNMNQLVGQYTKQSYEDFFNSKDTTEYDVVLTHPPFEASTDGGRKDQANNLWSKFTKRGFEVLKTGGTLAYVTPSSWLSPAADIGKGSTGIRFFRDYFQKYKTHFLNVNECARHFPGSGSTFSYFVVEKTEADEFLTQVQTAETNYEVDLRSINFLPKSMDQFAISINQKILEKKDKFGFVGNNLPETKIDYSEEQKDEFKISAYHTAADGGKFWYCKQPISTADKPKVIISISGLFVPYYDLGGMSFTGMCVVYYLKDNDSMDSIRSYLGSRLVRYLMSENKYTGWVSPILGDLPNVDKTRIWTDQELYDHFNLSSEEIDFLEKYRLT